MNITTKHLAAVLAVFALSTAVHAQDYPNRPVRWVVGFAAGGGSDVLARTVGQQLSQQLGQPVIVDNRPGAAGGIAAENTAKSSPDGYTLMSGDNSTLVFNPVLYRKLGYEPVRDFAPVGLMARFPLILAVPASSPFETGRQWLEEVKKAPGKYSYASPGVGTPHHMAMELIKQRLGLFILHVPYRGAAPAIQDVVGGQVPMMIVDSGSGLPMIRGGKLRPLAVVSSKRLSTLPDVPTFSEFGERDIEVSAWQGLVVPAETPGPVVDRLSTELQTAMRHPEVVRKLTEMGLEVSPSDARAMGAYLAEERATWHPLVRERGIQAD